MPEIIRDAGTGGGGGDFGCNLPHQLGSCGGVAHPTFVRAVNIKGDYFLELWLLAKKK